MKLEKHQIHIVMAILSLAVTLVSVIFLINRSAWDAHTRDAIGMMTEVEKLVVDLETGQRGYLLTGKSEFLEPYFASKLVLLQKINTLADFVSDNPPQVELTQQAEKLIQTWLIEVGKKEIELREEISHGRADAHILTSIIEKKHGKKIVDNFRAIAIKFKENEKNLLIIRNRQKNIAVYLSLAAAFFIGAFSSVSMMISRRSELRWQKRQAEQNLKLEKAHLESIAANQTKSEFIANLSHEFRTPLNVIIGYTELIEESIESGEEQAVLDDLSRVKSSSQQLLLMIEDILDYSSLEIKRIKLLPKKVEFREFITEIEFAAKVLARSLNNHFEIDDRTKIAALEIDDYRMRQVLMNLISNACKFTRKGHVSLLIESDAETVIFSVSDDGKGIPREQQREIFEPFMQIEKKDSNGGTGMGLAITAKLVNLMEGSLELSSEPNQGTTISVKFSLSGAIFYDDQIKEVS